MLADKTLNRKVSEENPQRSRRKTMLVLMGIQGQ
jgi:hypothetical protein